MEKKEIKLYENISINDLSLMLNINYTKIIKICVSLGLVVTINSKLNKDLIVLICDELGYKIKFKKKDNIYDIIKEDKKKKEKKKYIIRPPIVTIMGHVDHGKTSLLDYIRKTNTIIKEVGEITQHIAVYNVKITKNKSITFLDTPGHESFVSMRYRGLKITDIAIIVISSESGVMKQTIECINNAKSENIPIIFAFSKIDKINSNINKIKEQLSNLNIIVEDWGGKYLCQKISVKNGYGIDKLLNKILKKSEELNLKININKLCSGTIIESSLDKNKGYVSKILVQNGILKLGNYIISGIFYGKIKSIYNDNNKKIKKVYPSYPALVIGFNGAPDSGEKFYVFNNEKKIKKKILEIKKKKREENIKLKNLNSTNKKQINIIIKGDVYGSIEAIIDELEKISNKNYFINIIKKSVGNITESDIMLAKAVKATIIGFNIKILVNKKKKINYKKIYLFNLIYDIIDFFKEKIKKKEKITKKFIGSARIIKKFKINNIIIFGCIVLEGKINIKNKILVFRNKKEIYDGSILSIKRFNKNVNEVNKKNDFGIIIKNYNKLKKNDIIKSYIN